MSFDTEPSFIGRGISFPLRFENGSMVMTTGTEDIDRGILVVLSTAPGERVMRPAFGCKIWELLFEPINANTLGLMEEAVREALSRWEPRIDVLAVRRRAGRGRQVGRRARAHRHQLPRPGDQRPTQPRLSRST